MSRTIFGVHDPNKLIYGEKGKNDGWEVRTEELGHNPTHTGGTDYRDTPHTVIARLNNGYHPDGTLPLPEFYWAFSLRVQNFVHNSQGCSRWVIGNEMNHSQESVYGQPITPDLYGRCYKLCRDAIHSLPEHENDLVMPGATAPYNADTKYPGNENGDWVKYFLDVLEACGEVDGIVLHTYARGQHPSWVTSQDTMDPPFQTHYKGFLAYQDFLADLPPSRWHLPVYITETNPGADGVPWRDQNTGWVQAAFEEVNRWNKKPFGNKIRCLALYRYNTADLYTFKHKPHVIEDFYAAVKRGYTWTDGEPPDPPQGDDMVKNPSLEGEYVIQEGQGPIKVAPEWRAGWFEPSHESAKRPEFKPIFREQDPDLVLDGDKAQCWFWTYGLGVGWIWQRVEGLEVGKWYEFKANVYCWSSEFDDGDVSEKPGKMWARLGVDPWGDGNARGRAVEYGSAIVDNYDRWVELRVVFEARSTAAALFLWASPEHATKHNDVYWDLVSLTEWECEGGTEPPDPPDPPAGECLWDEEQFWTRFREEMAQSLSRGGWFYAGEGS